MKEKEHDLNKLKEEYEKIQKKHNLPSFRELNEDFTIEKIDSSETELLIREVRKYVGDKMANYMRFVENLINPVNSSMFIFSIIKIMDADDKKRLSDIYKVLMKNEVKFIEADLEFNEEREAAFIRDSYRQWQDMKKDTLRILEKVDKNWDSKIENNKKGYYG